MKEETYEWSGPLHPFDKNRQPRPELYGKFKGDVPEFRFFMDKNIGNPIVARKEFVAAVNKACVGFATSNYEDPFNSKFFKSNKLWIDINKIQGIEVTIPFDSPDGLAMRKKRQALMKDLFNANASYEKPACAG